MVISGRFACCARRVIVGLVGSLVGAASFWISCGPAAAAVVTVKSGMQFEGRVDRIAALGENPFAAAAKGEVAARPIVIIDDELRYTLVANSQVASFTESPPGGVERIKIDQRVAESGRKIASVGPILGITPFDEYGRRIFSMRGPRGRIDVIQGITEVTPSYAKVEGLLVGSAYVWDMRVNTNSIPRDSLTTILMRHLDPRDPDARLRIVRLYLQAERFRDALVELERVMRDFPDLEHLGEQADRIRQALAESVLREIQVRQRAGQNAQAMTLLNKFPETGIAGETLLKVRDMLAEYGRQDEQRKRAIQLFETHMGELKDEKQRAALVPIKDEITKELGANNLNRMADYLRLADDASMTADQKLALAMTGWLLGSGSGRENLTVALSLVQVRDAVVQYLASEAPAERQAILERLKSLEGASPEYIAKILENIKPPLAAPQTEQKIPGLYEITVPGIEQQNEFKYFLQLPPEYDPYKRYPCVVTMNSSVTSELQQIDWWAGAYDEKTHARTGQATRRGYIVLAPRWQKQYQSEYDYSVREHASVLYSLRDACRRFSIDTGRVFLSGHSLGGNAAWDIGLAHPDLWAGVVPIVANRGKYINHYTENGRGLPMYFVGGQMDGNWAQDNADKFNDYLRFANFDCTIVQYRGRGHEPYYEEIQRVFDWMELDAHRRNFFPTEINALSMRPWDNFFWWIEVDDIPKRSLISPEEWPDKGNIEARAIKTSARVVESNRITVTPRSGKVTIWLAPKIVQFDKPFGIVVEGRELRQDFKPSIEVILEDVRTRADRQNPFWAKAVWPERK